MASRAYNFKLALANYEKTTQYRLRIKASLRNQRNKSGINILMGISHSKLIKILQTMRLH